MSLAADRIAIDLRRFITPSYPEIDIRVVPWERDPTRLAICFTDPKFALIIPYRRWHCFTHLIPADYRSTHLDNTVWFELAPGEKPEDLRYPDEELIDDITPDVMRCLAGARFFELLDDAMCPEDADWQRCQCWGDFRNSRPILLNRGFKEDGESLGRRRVPPVVRRGYGIVDQMHVWQAPPQEALCGGEGLRRHSG